MREIKMIVCPTCGDKRCVHATDETATCAQRDIYEHNLWVQKRIAELEAALRALYSVAPAKPPGAGILAGIEQKHAAAIKATRAALKDKP